MKRLQWLAEAEITRLEELYKLPSLDEIEPASDIEEIRAEAERARQQKKRGRR